MNEFHIRLLNERDELRGRLGKLTTFMSTEKFKALEPYSQGLLAEQKAAMTHYLSVLERRIERLDEPEQREIGEPVEIGGHDIDRDGPPAFSS